MQGKQDFFRKKIIYKVNIFIDFLSSNNTFNFQANIISGVFEQNNFIKNSESNITICNKTSALPEITKAMKIKLPRHEAPVYELSIRLQEEKGSESRCIESQHMNTDEILFKIDEVISDLNLSHNQCVIF